MNEILDGIHAAIQQVAQSSSSQETPRGDDSTLRRELAATERRMRKVLGQMRSAKAQSVPLLFAMPLQTPGQCAKSAAVMRSALRCRKGRYRSAAQFGMAGNASPVVVSRLAPYLHDLLGDVTKKQSRVIAQAIKRGIDRKWADSTVARLLVSKADLDPDRAKVVARTEMSRAKSDIALGKKRDSAKVVFVLGDEDACPICKALEGTVRTVRKAQGVIPVHPNCSCEWQEAPKGAKVTRNEVSLTWNGRIYPKSVLLDSLLRFSALNQFCATGAGGGIDPGCSPDADGGIGGMAPFAADVRSLLAENPMPKDGPKPLPPGTSNPNLRAKHPEWQSAIEEHAAHREKMGKHLVAASMESLLRPLPVRAVSTGTDKERRSRFVRALDDLEKVRDVRSILSTAKAPAHPRGPEMLAAAKAEANDRYNRAVSQVRIHLSAMSESDQVKGRRRLESVTVNQFCATGEGGGIDPSCGSSGRKVVFTDSQKNSALKRLKDLPDAEEGYTHSPFGDASQVRLKSVGFTGTGDGGQIPEGNEFYTEMELDPSEVAYVQSSVTRAGVEKKLNGEWTDPKHGSSGLPVVRINENGSKILVDGNHRAVAQVLATGKFRARVTKVKSKKGTPGRYKFKFEKPS